MRDTSNPRSTGPSQAAIDAALDVMSYRQRKAGVLLERNRQQALTLAPQMVRNLAPEATTATVELVSEYRGLDGHPVVDEVLDSRGRPIGGAAEAAQRVVDQLVDLAGFDLWADGEDLFA